VPPYRVLPVTLTLKCGSGLKAVVLMVFYLANRFSINKKEGLWVLLLGSSGAVCMSLVHTQWLARVSQRALLADQVVWVV